MARVFTIFNHGTDFHRHKDENETISILSMACRGTEAVLEQTEEPSEENPLPWELKNSNPTFLICEGPGSDEVDPDESETNPIKSVPHSHPGKNNPIFGTSKGTKLSELNPKIEQKKLFGFGPKKSSGFQKDFMGQTSSNWKTTGRIYGSGWDDNVYKAVFLITHLQGLGQKPDVINLVGWSRGAVTCLKMANKLFEVYEKTIALNIFAIDPVPGGLTKVTDDISTIPPNVCNYMAPLAMDDDRANFQPSDRNMLQMLVPQSQTGTPTKGLAPNVHFLPFPGNHGDVVNVDVTEYARPSANLVRHLAHKFLSAHGTEFNPSKFGSHKVDLSPDEICAEYKSLKSNAEHIAKKASSGLIGVVGGRRKSRHVRTHREAYVTDPDLFINEHHRQCFLTPEIEAQKDPPVEFSGHVDWGTKKYVKPYQGNLFQMGITYS